MDMNELLEPFVRMLDAAATPATVRAIEHGGSPTRCGARLPSPASSMHSWPRSMAAQA
ncbi:hypothetical protein [Novosphingobium sp. THN1]|uniref:hypothetical protein n=1 Tax=Novosphingobium sp. THN1 TaxID=1016987 RepID=UPI001F071EC6|nr:hypothetical protein [Novosphingobium sp. THN1]